MLNIENSSAVYAICKTKLSENEKVIWWYEYALVSAQNASSAPQFEEFAPGNWSPNAFFAS